VISKKHTHNQSVGKRGEDEAAAFLGGKGYTILQRNFRCSEGELDIVARQRDVLVFVEVKTSSGDAFGPPQEWVDRRKQAQIGRVAQVYLQQLEDEPDCRFDVVAVQIQQDGQARINHIQDAFWLES